MATIGSLPDVGIDVPMPPELNLNAIDDLSIGQLAYLTYTAMSKMSERVADPATTHEFAKYDRSPGADWSGHEPAITQEDPDQATEPQTTNQEDPVGENGQPLIAPRPTPSPPEQLYDTLPMVAQMIRGIQHIQDSVLTSFVRHLQPAFTQQPEFFGTPEGITAFKDSTTYCKEVLQLSGQTTKKIHDRLTYVTWNPGQDPSMGVHQPKLLKLAKAFTQGAIPAENLDRIVWLDQDLTKYVRKTGASPDRKDAILRQFEPTLVEAAEASNPDAFNAARRRWADKIAYSLDEDGPPVGATVRKRADNIVRDQAYADGSGKIWIHATPDVFAEYKNFVLTQLSRNGAPAKVNENLTEWLYNPTADSTNTAINNTEANEKPTGSTSHNGATAAAGTSLFTDFEADHALSTATLDDLIIDQSSTQAVAREADGKPVTRSEITGIEALSPGQMIGAILIGALKAIFTMDPKELQLKKSHGAGATLTIIQDIETAYKTLGIGAIPGEAQRPRGPHGIIPTVIKRDNPDELGNPRCDNPEHLLGHSPPPWTGYISEGLNIGALHPRDTEILACDSKLVGQIWKHHHSVLNQRRAHRIFTAAQRQAILSRDRGCQAPGCTIIAAFCQIHHQKPWELGGPTDVDNAICLCAFHHAAVHNEKWTIRTIDGTHFFQPAPWLDPTQPLLRNMYWAL